MICRNLFATGTLSLLFFWGGTAATYGQHLNLDTISMPPAMRLATRGGIEQTFDVVAASELDRRPALTVEQLRIPTRDTPVPTVRVSAEQAKRHEFMTNLFVLATLATTFGIGLLVTVITIRRQSKRNAPLQLFGRA
jgi:hypothetical protein